ncbi:ABC transporter permease [bacterium]|nr:ABC transporter permease [bacterium]MBU1153147.1 ABC transporter permease [bacterium]
MNFLDCLISSISSLIQHKLRSFLTMLGMVIGVFAITTVLTISKGGKELILSEFLSAGTNIIMAFNAEMEQRMDKLAYLTEDQVMAMKETIPQIDDLSPMYFLMTPLKVKGRMKQITILGTPENFFRVRGIKASSGRIFTENEVRRCERVCVVGKELFYDLFGKTRTLGQEIRVEETYFRVIGVMGHKMEFGPIDINSAIGVPSSCVQRLLGAREIYAVQFLGKEGVSIPLLKNKIKNHLRQIFGGRDRFEVHSVDELLSMLDKVMGVIAIVLGSIAGVSLLVGGIGIMNIMLVSVRERTREIGIRKACGATKSNILLQFLIESLALCSIGGGIGILASIGLVLIISAVMKIAFFISSLAIIIGFGFSFFVGIFFGVYPACIAAKTNPVEAMRYE